MAKPDETSIWKKEITFRRKGKKGLRVPPVSEEPAKPESVADLLRPIAAAPVELDPVVLPPVTPLVSRPPDLAPVPVDEPPPAAPEPEVASPSREPPAAAAEPAPPHELEPEPEPEPESEPDREQEPAWEVPRAEAETVVALPLPGDWEEPEAPEAATEPERSPTRRERRAARQAADRLGKEQRRREKQLAKEAPALHKRLVGLKVGGSQVAAAQVVNKGGPRVVRMARAPLERGVVVGGELRDPEALAAALKTLFRKNKLPRTRVRLGISNNRIGVRTFEISGIDDPKQLANAIRFRAQETLPIPLDEAVLDYRILEARVGEDGATTHRVLLVVAHRELVDRYVAACRKAGLKLVGIDLEAFALLRALGDPAVESTAEDAGLVGVSIGHDRSTLAVSDGRVCEFARVLAWGGSSLDEAVARALDIPPPEAEPIKRQLSLAEEGEAAGLDAGRAADARRAMAAEVQVFARELIASLRFYQEQPSSLGIGEILITGGGAECGGLAEELERLIGVAVRVADPLSRVRVPRKVRDVASGQAGSLAIAVGLGIED